MKNQERILRIGSDISVIEKNRIEEGKYLTCFHVHYNPPRFSIWEKGKGVENSVSFEIVETGIRVLAVGRYSDEEIEEMKNIFTEWLNEEAV